MHVARNSIVSDAESLIIPVRFSPKVLQEMNAMKLIWAFKFSKSKDPATKQYKVYDLNDFVKVSLHRTIHDISLN